MDEWINKMWYVHTMKYLEKIEYEILLHATLKMKF